ncbi:MAG: hypothetical protein GXO33_07095 [Epsilonproteobacteria bacterium]|nr:hypothetical protein [Campylobacterota bacterium]
MTQRYWKKVAAFMAVAGVLAFGTPMTASDDVPSQEEIAEMINNPLSYLWMMAMQDDFVQMDGDVDGADKLKSNRFTVMPVMPMQLTEEYKLVLRPWLPLFSAKYPYGDPGNFNWVTGPDDKPIPTGIRATDYHGGIGDVGFWAALASNESAKPPFVWGVGVTAMFDTATRDQFGLGKNAAGPMGLAFYISDKWIAGVLAQHWVSYSGQNDRDHVALTDVQYVLRYRLTPETNIGMSPNAQYNWVTDDLTLPVGLGFDTLIKIGPLPVKIGMEAYKYVAYGNDDLHNDWHIRIFFVPVLPSPAWSRKPLF